MPQFGPKAFTTSDTQHAADMVGRMAKTAERGRLAKIAERGDTQPNFLNAPSDDVVASLMAKRRANVPDPPRMPSAPIDPAPGAMPIGPSRGNQMMPRVQGAMARQDKINEARKRSERARNFRSNRGDD